MTEKIKVDEDVAAQLEGEETVPAVEEPAVEGEPKAAGPEPLILSAEELENKITEAVKAAGLEASKMEKDKLYSTIEAVKAKNKELASQVELLTEENNKKVDAEELERLSKLTADELRDEQIQKANLRLEQVQSALVKLEEETAEKLRRKDLEMLRERLINSAQGQLIPELVMGDTPEELQTNFEKSKERFNFIKGQIAQDVKNTLKHESKSSVSIETPNQTKTSSPKEATSVTSSDIRNMTPEQFEKYKADLLSQHGV